jgi:hypothetical protein
MKVYISRYRNHWLSPYTILEKVCFWEKDRDVFYNLEDKPDHKYEKWVNFLTPICQSLQKFLDFVHPRVEYVKIDYYDTWNMDRTIGLIALPMLKQLKEKKHGSPFVDLEDVPEYLRATTTEEYDGQSTFDFYKEHKVKEGECDIHARWEWVMNEMIFAFEHHLDDSWEEKYRSGVIDWKNQPCAWDENGKATLFKTSNGPNHTYECDYDGMDVVYKRIQNGFRLFGKYYQGLWD